MGVNSNCLLHIADLRINGISQIELPIAYCQLLIELAGILKLVVFEKNIFKWT
jgi:hypothetical protein